MDTITLSMLPGYSHLFSEKKISSLIACQFTFCVVTTVVITYYILTRIFQKREKSFHEALSRMKPLREKIGEIEAQRQILAACLDNTEDRCNVHYALLQCVTQGRLPEGGEESATKEASRTKVHRRDRQKSGLSMASEMSSLKVSCKNEADGDGSYPPE